MKVDVKEGRVLLNMPDVASGMYIYSLIADDEVIATEKLILLKTDAYE